MKKNRLNDTWDIIGIWERHPKAMDFLNSKFQSQLDMFLHLAKDIDKQDLELNHEERWAMRKVYIGQFINPSGKFYMPFANSNVSIKEAAEDELWEEWMNRNLEKHNLEMIGCEGDSVSRFLCRYYDYDDECIKKMTHDDVEKYLFEILSEYRGDQLVTIPGMYEILSQHFNNEIIERYLEDL